MVQKNEKNEDYPMFLVSKFLVSWMEYYCRLWCFCPPTCHKVFKGLNGLKDGGGKYHLPVFYA